MNYDPTNAGSNPFSGGSSPFVKEQSFVTRVFNWMFIGLALTAVVAYFVSTQPSILMMIYSNFLIQIILILGLLAMVWNLSANINKMSPTGAITNFTVYSGLNGILLSSIFLIYTQASIVSTFFITAATFGVMALYGYTTKKDLSKLGSIAMMALIGIIIASVVNMFLHNSGLEMIISYIGVLVFVALTASDMQKIKMIGQSANYNPNMAILGALTLYLDFINLFLMLLRILGSRRR